MTSLRHLSLVVVLCGLLGTANAALACSIARRVPAPKLPSYRETITSPNGAFRGVPRCVRTASRAALLNEAALDAARHWRFTDAIADDCRDCDTIGEIAFEFVLD